MAMPGRIPIGVQLYSVRHDCEKDLPGTLAALSKMGYQGVEFAGYYKRDAKELRKLLDDNGLKCCGTHIGLDTLLGDQLDATVEFNRTLGNRYLIVPGLPKERTQSRRNWLDTSSIFNEISDRVKPAGMRVGYHNHSIEFMPLDGEMPWDTFFGNTRKEVIMQVDVGNALVAGADPVSFIRKYPGRAATIHVKEFSKSNPKAYVGEGDVNWKDVFDLLEKSGGTEWYIVEYEVPEVPALEGVARCLQNLRSMGK
jgi:sugar phosphate isomerase/epimerase